MSASLATSVTPDQAPTLWLIGDRLRFMGEVSGGTLGVVDVLVAPGSGTPPHRHPSPEVFLVAEGEVTFGLFDGGAPQSIVAGPGTVVTIPSGLGHNYTNRSAAPARFSAVVDIEMLRFFEDAGTPDMPPPGPPSEAMIGRLLAACARHGIEIIPAQ